MGLQSFDEIYCVSDKRVPILKEEIETIKESIGTALPPGYEEFLLKFGEGEFLDYFRPYRPSRIVSELEYNREVISHDYWDRGEIQLPPELRGPLVPFSDTVDNDLIAFNSNDQRQVYIFPRNACVLYKIEGTFIDLLNWAAERLSSEGYFFQPYNDYASLILNLPQDVEDLNTMEKRFSRIHASDHVVCNEASLHFFINRFGAHVKCHCDETQIAVHFDPEHAHEFLPLVGNALQGMNIEVREFYRFEKSLLPNFR